jgi:MFS transporter, ACS family, glucarate transporter
LPGARAAAVNVGGKYAGSLSGAMNIAGNISGALAPLAIGFILTWSHDNWNLTFYVPAVIDAMGILFWKFLDPVTPIEE